MLLNIPNHHAFDLAHIFYLLIVIAAIYGITTVAVRNITKQSSKNWYVLFWTMSSFLIHISPLYIYFLQGLPTPSTPLDTIIFPIFFCNLALWLLIVTALWSNKETKFYKYLATLTAYSGFIGAAIYLSYPVNFFVKPEVFTFLNLRPVLSHFAMLMGSLYLIVGKYIKINVREDLIVFSAGLLIVFLPVGLLVNGIFRIAGLPHPSAMYLGVGPFPDVKWLNAALLFPFMVLVAFIIMIIMTKLAPILEKRTANYKQKRAEKAQNNSK